MSAKPPLTRLGAAGIAMFAVHVALTTLLPRLPPFQHGYSIPLYLLAYVAMVFLAVEAWRTGPGRVEAARSIGSARWRVAVAVGILTFLALALALRAVDPVLYLRYWREEGVFEPLSFLSYAAGGLLVWRAADLAAADGRLDDPRPWRLPALVYFLLALEEIDYLGVFGGMIGRIHGEYAGALHDLIRLEELGLVGPRAWAALGAAAAVAALVLWRLRILSARWVARRLARPEALWILAGAAFLVLAQVQEAEMFGWVAAQPTPEEALEAVGSFCLFAWGVESAARILAPRGAR